MWRLGGGGGCLRVHPRPLRVLDFLESTGLKLTSRLFDASLEKLASPTSRARGGVRGKFGR